MLPSQTDPFSEVRDLAQRGMKIDAIKAYRLLTGVGLKEAKDAVEALENGQALPAAVPAPSQEPAGMAEVQQLAALGKKIDAIKAYRRLTDASLQEAKDAVEALEKGQALPAPVTLPLSGSQSTALEEIKRNLRQGKKIEAIKAYRQAFQVGLGAAQSAVNQLEAELKGLPSEPAISVNPFDEADRAPGRWLLVLFVFGLVCLALWVIFKAWPLGL